MTKDQTETKKTKEQKIALLEDKKKKLQAQITKLKAAQNSKNRKEDARKKILIGDWFLALVEKDQRAKDLYKLFLESGVTERDKKIFE